MPNMDGPTMVRHVKQLKPEIPVIFMSGYAEEAFRRNDENAATLSRNYAAAHMELAYYYRRLGHLQEGIAEMQRVERMFPGSPDQTHLAYF